MINGIDPKTMTSSKPSNEKILLEQFRKGDEQAYTQLYNLYKEKLTGNILRLVKSEELTKELLQELFLKVWENRAKIDPEKPFRAYLHTLMRNLIYDVFRKSKRDRRLEAQLMSASTELYAHIEEALFQKENHEILSAAIDKLPGQCKQVFVLKKIHGKSYKEISEELGIAPSTINGHIQRANQLLKTELTRPGTDTILLITSFMLYQI